MSWVWGGILLDLCSFLSFATSEIEITRRCMVLLFGVFVTGNSGMSRVQSVVCCSWCTILYLQVSFFGVWSETSTRVMHFRESGADLISLADGLTTGVTAKNQPCNTRHCTTRRSQASMCGRDLFPLSSTQHVDQTTEHFLATKKPTKSMFDALQPEWQSISWLKHCVATAHYFAHFDHDKSRRCTRVKR